MEPFNYILIEIVHQWFLRKCRLVYTAVNLFVKYYGRIYCQKYPKIYHTSMYIDELKSRKETHG